MRETNPAVNPELLQALAQSFIRDSFDMKNLIRTICQSQTYQLSSIPNEFNAKDKTYFSRYYPKRLNAEVLYDAINQMTDSQANFSGLPVGTRAVQLPDNSFNSQSYFLTVFGRPDSSSSCECERSSDASLAQSLHLLNSKDIQGKLASGSGRAAKLSTDKREDDAKIRELFLLAFAREPSGSEVLLARQHLEREIKDTKGVKKPANKKESYEDVIWALFNTKEFLFNH